MPSDNDDQFFVGSVNESMKKSQYTGRSNSIGLWLVLVFVLAILFLGYIGFSLHEERNYVKFKLKQSVHSNKVPVYAAYHDSQDKLDQLVKAENNVNLTMIHSNVDLDFYNQGYKVHAFNELVSDRIGYQARPIPDTRPKECLDITYDVHAQVSVIICFYNEATSTLLRTISSVFERTSPMLLKEVIVVDDGSVQTYVLCDIAETKNITIINPSYMTSIMC